MSLFEQLKASCQDDWDGYIRHDFVRQLGAGTLPEACFRHYLKQDYLFLIEFARCYALAAVQGETLADIRYAKDAMGALLDVELDLHIAYCRDWGINPDELEALETEPANKAYTDYVMQCGLDHGPLALRCALAPCGQGYGEIGSWLAAEDALDTSGRYRSWIEMYSGKEYQDAIAVERSYLDQLAERQGDTLNFDQLAGIFRTATQLEIGFWDMGMSPPPRTE